MSDKLNDGNSPSIDKTTIDLFGTERVVCLTKAAKLTRETPEVNFLVPRNRYDLTVCISCYQEADFIIDTIKTVADAVNQIKTVKFEIIVMDDCSSDPSAQIIVDFMKANQDLNLLYVRNTVNLGLAQSFTDAAFLGLGEYYRLVCGDNAEPREAIFAILSAIGETDVVIPYYLNTNRRNYFRRTLSATYTLLINAISGNRIKYYNGLQVYKRRDVMRWHSNTKGFGFQAELFCTLLSRGASYKEVGVEAVERKEAEDSKAISIKNMLSVFHSIAEILIRRVSSHVYKSPKPYCKS